MVTKEQFAEGLQKAQHTDTQKNLGDRSSYIGSSDIAGCPRMVILAKTSPENHDLKTLIRFQRGPCIYGHRGCQPEKHQQTDHASFDPDGKHPGKGPGVKGCHQHWHDSPGGTRG